MGKEFLTIEILEYFKTGVVYSSVNSVYSVLPSIIKPVCNVLSLVWTLLNGVFNIRPALLKYVTTWDVTKVFSFIKSKPTLTNCDLKTISHRLAILSCLTTGQKDQTIKCLNLEYIKISSDKVVSLVPETLKTTRPGTSHHLPPIELSILNSISKWQHLLQVLVANQLLLSFVQPHKSISPTTLLRWFITVMKESGISVNIFGSHSTRSTSTSKGKDIGVIIQRNYEVSRIVEGKNIFTTLWYAFWCYLYKKHIWCWLFTKQYLLIKLREIQDY